MVLGVLILSVLASSGCSSKSKAPTEPSAAETAGAEGGTKASTADSGEASGKDAAKTETGTPDAVKEAGAAPGAPEETAYPAPLAPSDPGKSGPSEDDWKSAVTKVGLNEKPAFSRDGRRLLFVSRERSLHKHRQLYELNLTTQDEKRLTFQDGDVFEGVYNMEDGSIFYTSTTDAIKERPALFYPDLARTPWPRTDLYRIKSLQEPHERWTSSLEFEGFIHVFTEKPGFTFIVLSRMLRDDIQLFRSAMAKPPKFQSLIRRPGHRVHSYTTFGKKRWAAWVEEDKEGQGQLLFSVAGKKALTLKTGLHEVRDLQLLEVGRAPTLKDSGEVLFTARREKGGLRQAFWLRLKDSCLQSFMRLNANIRDLRLSYDRKVLAWTMATPTRSQVFVAPLMAPSTPCESL